MLRFAPFGPVFRTLSALFIALPALAQPQRGMPAINADWLPVTDAERQMSAPVVEPDAGAEAIFWRVHVYDDLSGDSVRRVFYHYIRLKVFNEKGTKQVTTVEIPHDSDTSVLYVTGRTVKADGTIVELQKDAVHRTEGIRGARRNRRMVSFAMPGVEPGAIVEYRWKEERYNTNLLYMRLPVQREYPVQRVTYFVMPLSREYTTYRMAVWRFHCPEAPLKQERDGFNSITLEKIPAFRAEPMMPAEPNVKPWMLIFYSQGGSREPEKYWKDVGRKTYKELKLSLKTNDQLKAAAASATSGAKSDEEKVLGLIRYMRANFRGLYDDGVSDAERVKVLKGMPKERLRTAPEIFKSGIGTADELNTLFAALALEAGLDARPALIASRNDVYFDERMSEQFFLRSIDMAVKSETGWKLYDVSARHLHPAMVSWHEEGVKALIADPDTPVFVPSPISPPDKSVELREGKFRLSEDGTLEGTVEATYTGHVAAEQRLDLKGASTEQQVEELRKDLTGTYPGAEVGNTEIRNASDPEQPLIVSYAIRIPGYAQRTGKRLIFAPFYFRRGTTPLFPASTRRFDVHFQYASTEVDVVRIQLPAGFELDHAQNPGGLEFGPPGSYKLDMKISGGGELICRRELVFGNNGALIFPQDSYSALKRVFDEIHRRDTLSLSARQAAAGTVSGQ